MAKIPTYTSTNTPSAQDLAPKRGAQDMTVSVGSPSISSPPSFKDTAGKAAGEMLIEFADKMRKVENANDDAKAKTEYTKAKLAYSEMVNKSNDPAILDDFDKVSNDWTESALKHYRDPQAKAEAKQGFELDNTIFKNKLQGVVWQKEVAVSQFEGDSAIAMQVERGYSASLEELEDIKKEIKNIINGRVSNGVWDTAVGLKKEKDALASIRTGRPEKAIYDDMSTQEDESWVLGQLKAGSKGAFPELNHDERIEAIKKSQSRIHTNNQKFKTQVNDAKQVRLDNVYEKFYSGNLNLADIKVEEKVPEEEGGIDPKTLGRIKEDMLDMKVSQLTAIAKNNDKAERYLNEINRYLSPETGREQALEVLADAFSNGLLDSEEAKVIHDMRRHVADVRWQARADASMKITRWAFKLLTKTKDKTEAALNMKRFFNEIPQTDGSSLAVSELAKKIDIESQVKNNPNRTMYKIGDIIPNPRTGKSAKVVGFDYDGEPIVDEIE